MSQKELRKTKSITTVKDFPSRHTLKNQMIPLSVVKLGNFNNLFQALALLP